MSTMTDTGKRNAEEAKADAAAPSGMIDCPFNRHYADLRAFMKQDKAFLGHMIIQEYDDEDSENEQIDSDDLTEEHKQLYREKEIDSMQKLILGDQADRGVMMFDTSFSYHVMDKWALLNKNIACTKDPSKKLDRLFALSYNLSEFDVWMHDNEGDMGELVKGLARAWKSLLRKYSDEELGWDSQYTKPGMLEFLKQFKDKIESMPKYYKLGKFNFE